MDSFSFPDLQRETFFKILSALRAQRWSQRAAARWRTGLLLLLCWLHLCTCLDEECVLAVVGRPVLLPCFYPPLRTFGNVTIEWRKEDEVVLRSMFENNQKVLESSPGGSRLSPNATVTGDVSLEVPTLDPTEPRVHFGLFVNPEVKEDPAVCTVCVRIAASFSRPLLRREDPAGLENETRFRCGSTGGFPEPRVRWLLNQSAEPPEGSVRTVSVQLPDSRLYTVTSYLRVEVSAALSVSCTVENALLNESLTSTSRGTPPRGGVSRASEAMWIFSTALCAVVGVMVAVGVGYQIHLDRASKRKKLERQRQQGKRGYKRRPSADERESTAETEVQMVASQETDV